jgi:hypothetical protein
MSSVTDYFERMHRKEHQNPSSRWFTIAAGIVFILVGAVETRTQSLSHALSIMAIGLGMTLFGFTYTRLRNSPWRVPALIAEFALWLGGAYWLIRPIF